MKNNILPSGQFPEGIFKVCAEMGEVAPSPNFIRRANAPRAFADIALRDVTEPPICLFIKFALKAKINKILDYWKIFGYN